MAKPKVWLALKGNPVVTGAWGNSPDYYKQYGQKGHNGIDYRAPVGTPVHASADGTIHFEGWGKNFSWMGAVAGISVVIDHGTFYTGYAHLSRTIIDKGMKVKRGQLIGYSGNTGGTTGPHLHWEVLPKPPAFGNGYAGRVNPTTLVELRTYGTPDMPANHRKTANATVNVRKAPDDTAPIGQEKLKANTEYVIKGWTLGKRVGDFNMWYVLPNGLFAWSGAFTTQSKDGIADTPYTPPPVITKKTEKKEEAVPFTTKKQDNASLPKGTEKVVTAGVNGKRTITYEVTLTDGKETARVVKSDVTDPKPVTKVVDVGTYVAPVITTKQVVETTPIPFEKKHLDSAEIPLGVEEVVEPGVDGLITKTIEITYTDGKETGRKVLSEVRKEPVTRLVLVGTYVPPVVVVENQESTSTVPFTTVWVETDELPLGEERVKQEGIDGLITEVVEITFTDGVETDRKVVSSENIDPVNKVIEVGTYVEPDLPATRKGCGIITAAAVGIVGIVVALFTSLGQG